MNITSLIFRRRYPVPVTLDDLYRAIVMADMVGILAELRKLLSKGPDHA